MKTMTLLVMLASVTVAWAQSPAFSSQPVPERPPAGGFGHSLDGHDSPEEPPALIPLIEVNSIRVDELMDIVKERLKELGEPVPNIVFKNGAEARGISSLQIRNVSFKGLLHALEAIAGVSVEILENPGGEEIIVLTGPVPPARHAGRGFSGGGGEAPAPSYGFVPPDPFAGFDGGRAEARQVTRVFATSDLGVKEEDLMSTIRAVWDVSDPDWAKGERSARLIFHPGTRMLVVKATPDRLGDVEQVIQQLEQVKERNEKGEAMEVRRRMQEIERSGERALMEAEQARERVIHEMEQDRARMKEKVRVLEERLRDSELQRIRIREDEKARGERR